MYELIHDPIVRLIARPQFLGVPSELGFPKEGQDQGSHAERLIEACGRVCYDSFGRGRSSEQYHQHLQEVGHGSVTEHAMWSFFISGVSRGLTHELVRHRVGVAYAQRSTRYVDESESPWVVPPLFRAALDDTKEVQGLKEEAVAELERIRREASTSYERLMMLGQQVLEHTAAELGPMDRRKVVRGAARSVLGQGLNTSIIFSANLRALVHVALMRCVRYAEAEIRIVAVRLVEIMKQEAPAYFDRIEFRTCPDRLGPEICGGLKRLQPY